MSAIIFNAKMFINEQMEDRLLSIARDVTVRAVKACAEEYNFNYEDAIRLLNLEQLVVEKRAPKVKGDKPAKQPKRIVLKSKYPVPFCGKVNENCCISLVYNRGLYTQCTGKKCQSPYAEVDNKSYCKSCHVKAKQYFDENGSYITEFDTVHSRLNQDLYEFKDLKGRSPIAYTKLMKKLKKSEEEVRAEFARIGAEVPEEHFDYIEIDSNSKRGRPKSEPKEKKEKKEGVRKGRPSKEKKVINIDTSGDDDLFASLVANANEADSDNESSKSDKKAQKEQKEQEKAEREAKKAQEKAEKEAKLAQEKEAKKAKLAQEKEAKIAQEKAEKEAKKAQEKAEKEAKLAQEKAEKEAKLAKEKAEKEAKKAEEKEAKKSKKCDEPKKDDKPKKADVAEEPKKVVAEEPKKEEEAERVKKITFNNVKYLMSLKSGVVYDYDKYANEGEQVVVGKVDSETMKTLSWDKVKSVVILTKTSDAEESEEEYDSESDDE